MGTAQHGVLMARFKNGRQDYFVGNHPLWELFRAVYQMTRRPFVLGGLMVISGYAWALLRQAKRPVSRDLIVFQRREQMVRLKRFLTRCTGSGARTFGTSS
jgi:hypothetical protein